MIIGESGEISQLFRRLTVFMTAGKENRKELRKVSRLRWLGGL